MVGMEQLTNWEPCASPCGPTGFRPPRGVGIVTNRMWCDMEAARLRALGRRAKVVQLKNGNVAVFAKPLSGWAQKELVQKD